METLLLPFQFGFMQNAFLVAALVAVGRRCCRAFWCSRMGAVMGDAISHAVLPGIVLAHVLGLPLILGAFAAGMFTAVATGFLAGNSRVKPDTVMGVVFSGMFGLGIVLFVAVDSELHLNHILFGNMLGVEAHELWQAPPVGRGDPDPCAEVEGLASAQLRPGAGPRGGAGGGLAALRASGADRADRWWPR